MKIVYSFTIENETR